jgi:hypothetical protein
MLPGAKQRQILEVALDTALVTHGDEPVEQRLGLVFAGSRHDRGLSLGAASPEQTRRRRS